MCHAVKNAPPRASTHMEFKSVEIATRCLDRRHMLLCFPEYDGAVSQEKKSIGVMLPLKRGWDGDPCNKNIQMSHARALAREFDGRIQ
jgi:hypothetical protein